jgi:Ca2+-binding RTX toxin-like protein
MWGGTGADVFVFSDVEAADLDLVQDFEVGVDLIRIETGGTTLGFGDLGLADVGGVAEFTLDGATVRLVGLTAAEIGADSFDFV